MLLLLHTLNAVAAVLQILHTNDLHASLKTAGHPLEGKREMGGWAQIAATMNRLEGEAAQQGIPTIRLDGGDFFEGSAYYFADQGRPVLKTIDAMKYNAIAHGNHDGLCGAAALNALYGEGWFHTPLLAANFVVNKKNLGFLSRQLQDPQHNVVTLHRAGGIKVNVFGLTTNEKVYEWATEVNTDPEDVAIEKPIQHGLRIMKQIRNLNNALRGTPDWHNRAHLNLAVTHLGHEQDLELGKAVHGIDGIIGGHSHKLLRQPLIANPGSRYHETPIFQAGYNGKYVGVIRVELDTLPLPGKSRKRPVLLSYRLEPVYADGPKDPEVQCHVDEAEYLLSKEYGSKYLEEHIGWSQVPLRTGEFGPTPFALFAAESIRQAVRRPKDNQLASLDDPKFDEYAHVGIDIGSFHGLVDQPPGFITRKTLMQMYPRKFEMDHKQGATVYRGKMTAWVLALAVQWASKYGLFLSSPHMVFGKWTRSGDAQLNWQNKKPVTINGAEFPSSETIISVLPGAPAGGGGFFPSVAPTRIPLDYTVALPELLARGAKHITDFHDLFMGTLVDTGVTIWSAMERYLRHTDKNGKVIERAIEDFSNTKTGSLLQPQEGMTTPNDKLFRPKEIVGDYHDFLRELDDTVRRCKDARDPIACATS